jgi:hypothetical protein
MRIARWQTLPVICDFLFADGFDIQLKPHRGKVLTAVCYRHQVEHIAANHDRLAQRADEKKSEKAAAARREKTPPRERRAIAARPRRLVGAGRGVTEVDPVSMRPIAPAK